MTICSHVQKCDPRNFGQNLGFFTDRVKISRGYQVKKYNHWNFGKNTIISEIASKVVRDFRVKIVVLEIFEKI